VSVRHVPPPLAWRTAKNLLGRMACEYGDANRDGHDHAVCLRDDEAYFADRLLKLVNALCRDHDDDVLDALTELQETLHDAT